MNVKKVLIPSLLIIISLIAIIGISCAIKLRFDEMMRVSVDKNGYSELRIHRSYGVYKIRARISGDIVANLDYQEYSLPDRDC